MTIHGGTPPWRAPHACLLVLQRRVAHIACQSQFSDCLYTRLWKGQIGALRSCGPAPLALGPIPVLTLVDDCRLRSPVLLEQLSDEVVVVAIVLGHMQIVPLVLCFAVCGQHLDFTTLPALFTSASLRLRSRVFIDLLCSLA